MSNMALTGAVNRRAGKEFESMMEAACRFYYEKGFAVIEKTPEPMLVLRTYGDRKYTQFIACYEKQAQPDFKGCLCDGTCIIFDAKHTSSDRIHQSAVTKTQEEIFNKYSKMNARCYVMVSLSFEKFYRVPWDIWRGMKELFGHKYMNEDELRKYKVKFINVVRFLEGIELR